MRFEVFEYDARETRIAFPARTTAVEGLVQDFVGLVTGKACLHLTVKSDLELAGSFDLGVGQPMQER